MKFRDNVSVVQADFLRYCLRQEAVRPEEEINHLAWELCAIGEYAIDSGDARMDELGYRELLSWGSWTDYARHICPDSGDREGLYDVLVYEPLFGKLLNWNDIAAFIRGTYMVEE